jgi:hypothetical protein
MPKAVSRFAVFISCCALGMVAACTCPDLIEQQQGTSHVRDVTINEFNAGWAAGAPVPSYSIHTFRFPNDVVHSTGTLPNDQRVADGKFLVLASRQFSFGVPSATYTAEAISIRPPNEQLAGDVMVVTVNPAVAPAAATIRVAGWIAPFASTLPTASAPAFLACLQSPVTQASLNGLASAAVRAGAGLPNATSQPDRAIIVRDPSGLDVTATVSAPANIVTEFNTIPEVLAVDLTVHVGDLFFYRSRNGAPFAMLVADIQQGATAPNINRVSLKYAELYGVPTLQ